MTGNNLVLTWQAVSLLVTVFLAWSGLLLGSIKWLLDRSQRAMDDRFEALEKEIRQWQRVERELLELKATLPEKYVQREDWVREIGSLSNKMDRQRWLIEKLIGGRDA